MDELSNRLGTRLAKSCYVGGGAFLLMLSKVIKIGGQPDEVTFLGVEITSER